MIRVAGLAKSYALGGAAVPVLHGIDLEVGAGEMVALTGPSGSGKSTLMNILGCLDSPDEGSYHLDGWPVATLAEPQLAALRNRCIGFVFQTFQLLPRFNAWENVAQPLVYRGLSPRARKAAACEALEQVGLEHRLTHRPNELSGGQRQRVAIARALVGRPRLLLADEPTGNLDSRTAAEIMDLLAQLHADGLTVVIVTHESEVARRCDRIVRLRDGAICADPAEAAPLRAGA